MGHLLKYTETLHVVPKQFSLAEIGSAEMKTKAGDDENIL